MLGRAGYAAVLVLAACSGAVDVIDARDGGPRHDAGPRRDGGFPTSTTALSIMTWNIEMFPKSTRTSSAVIDILHTLKPDLVGVQELRHPGEFDRLIAALPDYDGAWIFDDFLSLGVLYRPDRIRVQNVKALFEGDDYAFPRPLLSADVEVLGPNGEVRFDFVFINLHLKAQGDSRSQSRRIAAISDLDRYLDEQLRTGGEQDYVILGDYNDRLLDIGANNVFQRLLDQPERFTFLTYGLESEGNISYVPFPGFIDHILITNDALEEFGRGWVQAVPLESMVPNYLGVVSDHRPVRALFELP